MLYSYVYADKGEKRKGFISSESLKTAKDTLFKEKFVVIEISSINDVDVSYTLTIEQILRFTKDLRQFLKAGMQLYAALETIEKVARNNKEHVVFVSLCRSVSSGKSLSESMSLFPRSFSSLYRSMLFAGENEGAVMPALDQLALLLEKRQKTKSAIQKAIAYPLFLLCLSCCVICFLLLVLIPSIEELFEGRTVHYFTRFILSLSLGMRNYYVWILSAFAIIAVFLGVVSMKASLRKKSYLLFCKLPYVSTLQKTSDTARFFRSLSTLLSCGTPLLSGITESVEVVSNPLLKEEFIQMKEKLLQGVPLSHSFAASHSFSPVISNILEVGETASTLDQATNDIAEMYEKTFDGFIDKITTLLAPMMLVFIGIIVGITLLAVMMPLTDVSSITM